MFIASIFWFAISGGSALSQNCSLLMLFILGSFMIIGVIETITDSINSINWPTEKGVLKTALVVRHSSNSTSGTSGFIYKPAVVVEYEVGGVKHTCRDVRFADTLGTRSSAKLAIEQVKALKDDLKVYYNPVNSGFSVIIPGFTVSMALTPLVGVSAIIASIAIYFA